MDDCHGQQTLSIRVRNFVCEWWITNTFFFLLIIEQINHFSFIRVAHLQIHILSGAGWFTSNFDLCAISICTLHIRVVAVGNSIVSYHRMRQRHFDWRVRIHIDCTISRTLLCHRESAQKTAGKRHTKYNSGFYDAYSLHTLEQTHTHTRTHFIHVIGIIKWILNYFHPHAMLLLLSLPLL